MKPAALILLVFIVVFCTSVFPQAPHEVRTFSIAGHSGSVKIVEVSGRSYIAVDDLARLTQGSLSFAGNQTVLALPAEQVATSSTPAKTGFSRQFLEAGIEAMTTIREWRMAVVNSIQNNAPAPEEWIGTLRRKSDEKLALAAAARSTSDDRSGYPLLAAEFSNMQKLSEKFLASRKALQYIDPKSIDNDPLDQQILTCARSLASMAADNEFREEPACTEYQ